MAAQTKKQLPEYGLFDKLAAVTIGLATIASIPGFAQVGTVEAASVEQDPYASNVVVAASYRNELQDEIGGLANPQRPPAPKIQQNTVTPAIEQTPQTVEDGSVWDKLAKCESGGNWAINTGNGYYGGIQFSLGSWRSVGGTGLPSDASREEQIMRGEMLRARGGWNHWPACSRSLGLI